MERIESLQNARVKKWVSLHQKKERDKQGLFLIEGEHLIQEALKENIVETIITDQENIFAFDSIVYVNDSIMNKISQNVSSVHYIAVCRQFHKNITKKDRILVLDGVQDPGNLGTLIRTAVSFSFDAVYLSKECVDLYNDKTIRSTQGAMFHIPVIRCDLNEKVKELQSEGIDVVATTLENAVPLQQLKTNNKMVFILGNEGQGVSRYLQDISNQRVRIEMDGFESLNVAVAGGIIMYQYRNIH